jgi:hypothetical protein
MHTFKGICLAVLISLVLIGHSHILSSNYRMCSIKKGEENRSKKERNRKEGNSQQDREAKPAERDTSQKQHGTPRSPGMFDHMKRSVPPMAYTLQQW